MSNAALDLRIGDTDDGTASFLPEGSDENPTPEELVAKITPVRFADNRTLVFEMCDVSFFAGHCGNAPRNANLNDDYSFEEESDLVGPILPLAFDGDGKVNKTIYIKDWGGRVVIRAKMENLPGQPEVAANCTKRPTAVERGSR